MGMGGSELQIELGSDVEVGVEMSPGFSPSTLPRSSRTGLLARSRRWSQDGSRGSSRQGN